jgi:hypothetical protein
MANVDFKGGEPDRGKPRTGETFVVTRSKNCKTVQPAYFTFTLYAERHFSLSHSLSLSGSPALSIYLSFSER